MIAVGLVAATSVAAADSASEAERLFEIGQVAFDAKLYRDAHTAWTQSYVLSREPALLFNIGQAARLGGDCTTARGSYRKFLELDSDSTLRSDAEAILVELGDCLAKPSGSLGTSESRSRSLRHKRIAGIAAMSGGGLFVLTGLAYGGKARRLGKEVTLACEFGCDWSAVEPTANEGKRAELNQWVLLGLGVTALATGGVLYYQGTRERRSSLVVAPTPGGGAVSWRGTW